MLEVGTIGDIKVRFTEHALQRIIEMKITPAEVSELVASPVAMYDCKNTPGKFYHRRGKYVFLFGKDGDVYVVITAMYASMEDWCEAAKNGDLPEGRPLRYVSTIPRRRRD